MIHKSFCGVFGNQYNQEMLNPGELLEYSMEPKTSIKLSLRYQEVIKYGQKMLD